MTIVNPVQSSAGVVHTASTSQLRRSNLFINSGAKTMPTSSPTNILTIAEEDIAKGWAWVTGEAKDIYTALKPLVEKALTAFESSLVNDLWGAAASFITGVLAGGPVGGGVSLLADLETAFLNTLGHLWPSLLSAAQTLGSVLLQSLLGVLHVKQVQA